MEIFWYRGKKTQRFSGYWMCEFQLKRMECLALDFVKKRMIEKITGKRATNVFHMHTDLMCTAGIQMKFYQGIAVADCKPFIMRHCSFSFFEVYFSGNYRVVHSCDRRGNCTLLRRDSVSEREISAPDLALFHLGGEKRAA